MHIKNTLGNVQFMQRINRLKVLECIRNEDGIARPEIAKITGLSLSSITNIVAYLLEKKLVTEAGPVDTKEVGRKATLLRFNPEVTNLICVDIESTSMSVALSNMGGDIQEKREVELPSFHSEKKFLEILKGEIELFLKKSEEADQPRVAGIGIAVSGIVEDEKSLVISSGLRLKDLSLKEDLEKLFAIPVYVQNNSRTKALAEVKKYGDKLEQNVIFLDLTMGIGLIYFYERKIQEAVLGEFGHTTVKKNGPACFCGNHGCLEVMCSVETILRQCEERLAQGGCGVLRSNMEENNSTLSYDIVLKSFGDGDEDVNAILTECGEYLGIAIANIVNIFHPQRLIINGDVLLQSEFIYKIAVEEAARRAYEQLIRNMVIDRVSIGDETTLKGIALYVADRIFELAGPEL